MPNINHVIYDKTTGRILQSGIADSATLDATGESYLEVATFDPTLSVNYYVQNGQLTARPALPIAVSKTSVLADGTDSAVLGGVPAGSNLAIAGPLPLNAATADGTDLALTFALPGTYTVFIQPFPYKDLQVTLNAT